MNEKIMIIKHIENEGPGLIESIFIKKGWEMKTIELFRGETFPEGLDNTMAVISLGGPMCANNIEEFPFLQDEISFINRVLKEEMPFLGICLGAQLLAKTCGGRVFKASKPEVGWHSIEISEEGQKDILFQDISNNMGVFQWHQDTFTMPREGIHLARSSACKNQAFRVGNNAYGLQFHIEATEGMVNSWMTGNIEKKFNPGKIISDTSVKIEQFLSQYEKILKNFIRIIESYLRYKKILNQYIEINKESTKKKQILWWEMEEIHFDLTMNKA